jgi:mannose-6-phosphate isomerase-like protein (cupin superfamily)
MGAPGGCPLRSAGWPDCRSARRAVGRRVADGEPGAVASRRHRGASLPPPGAWGAPRLPFVSDFSHTNLMDAEDSAAGRGGHVEARLGRKHLDSDHLGVSYFRYGAGYRSPYGHRHREQEEAYVVVGGSGRMRLGDEIVELRQWDAVRVAPDVVRAFEGGPEGLEIIAVGADRPEGGDGEMVQDFWTE